MIDSQQIDYGSIQYNRDMHEAIFLDRDGVIIENRPNYVRDWSDVEFYPQSLEALSRLKRTHYKVVIITNQAGIGRGIIARQTADDINRLLVEVITKAGGRIDGVFMCPHRPEDGCDCRKPRPGLIFQAAKALDLDLRNSILIGDSLSDLQAGQSAGLSKVILVKTGLGTKQLGILKSTGTGVQEILIFDSLAHAINNLLKA